jgi:hypothetical protein
MKITTIQTPPPPPITEVNISFTPVEVKRLLIVLRYSNVVSQSNIDFRDDLIDHLVEAGFSFPSK